MFDVKFWNEIKEKYPKAYSELLDTKLKNISNGVEKLKVLCYCDIETYFDELGIIMIIEINYICKPNKVDFSYYKNTWSYYVLQQNKIPESKLDNKTRDEAKEQTILKAFDILQKQLEAKDVK